MNPIDNLRIRVGKRCHWKAHNIVEAALYNGTLVRPKSCEKCGCEGSCKNGASLIQAHHDDYNKPLEVKWLCRKCHYDWHQENDSVMADIVKSPFKGWTGRKHRKTSITKMMGPRPNTKQTPQERKAYEDSLFKIGKYPSYGYSLNGQKLKYHRVVMERKLGRLIRRDELIYFVNGDKNDLRPENIEIRLTKSVLKRKNRIP